MNKGTDRTRVTPSLDFQYTGKSTVHATVLYDDAVCMVLNVSAYLYLMVVSSITCMFLELLLLVYYSVYYSVVQLRVYRSWSYSVELLS